MILLYSSFVRKCHKFSPFFITFIIGRYPLWISDRFKFFLITKWHNSLSVLLLRELFGSQKTKQEKQNKTKKKKKQQKTKTTIPNKRKQENKIKKNPKRVDTPLNFRISFSKKFDIIHCPRPLNVLSLIILTCNSICQYQGHNSVTKQKTNSYKNWDKTETKIKPK